MLSACTIPSLTQTPKVSVESIQVIRVELRGQDIQMMKETNVRIKPATPISFIQTDKPIYKPGQTGIFLFLTLLKFLVGKTKHGQIALVVNYSRLNNQSCLKSGALP